MRTLEFPEDKHLYFQEWELLVLYKLHWELSSITPIDYLDQAIPRLGLNEEVVDLIDLRRRVQTMWKAMHET